MPLSWLIPRVVANQNEEKEERSDARGTRMDGVNISAQLDRFKDSFLVAAAKVRKNGG